MTASDPATVLHPSEERRVREASAWLSMEQPHRHLAICVAYHLCDSFDEIDHIVTQPTNVAQRKLKKCPLPELCTVRQVQFGPRVNQCMPQLAFHLNHIAHRWCRSIVDRWVRRRNCDLGI